MHSSILHNKEKFYSITLEYYSKCIMSKHYFEFILQKQMYLKITWEVYKNTKWNVNVSQYT